eukprot:5782163-Amphidinium_carterae.1
MTRDFNSQMQKLKVLFRNRGSTPTPPQSQDLQRDAAASGPEFSKHCLAEARFAADELRREHF